MEGDREQKQKYLRENILQRQYDAEEFMDFCENLKGSVDIDSWSLNQLKDIVQKFIASNSKTLHVSPFEYGASQHQPQPLENFDWDNAFAATAPQPVNLNPVDLDFLQSMGMSPSPPKPNKASNKIPPKDILTDPSAILAKINNKNNEFISAFNANALNKRPSAEVKEVPRQEPVFHSLVDQPTVFVPPPAIKESGMVEQEFKASIKCKSFSNKPRLDGDYEVIVSGHEIINPNPFVPNYVLYTLITNPIGREVKRRLKDFQALRGLLKKIFPSTQIPFLERCGRLSETEPSVIKKQKLFLQSFLNSLLMNKSIRCKIIDDFLLEESLDTLKKNFRDFEKLERPKAIEDLYTPSGRVDVELNASGKKILSQQELYLDYLQPKFMRLKELYDQLLLSTANSVRIMGDISELYDSLRASTRNVNAMFPETHRSLSLQESLQRISDLHKHWALSLKTQAKLMEVEIRHLYRYQHDNLQTIREVARTATALTDTYTKRTDKEVALKEQYEYNKKLTDFKTGVDNASKNTCVLRHQAGYYLSASAAEILRYFEELSQKLNKKFRIFSVLQMNINHDLDHHWKAFEEFSQK